MLFWLSFADPTKPRGQQAIGVSLIEADTRPEAIAKAKTLGCHQGSNVLADVVDPDDYPEEMRNRALTKEELIALADVGSVCAEHTTGTVLCRDGITLHERR